MNLDYLAAGGGRQLLEFIEGILHLPGSAVFEFKANQEDPFGPVIGGRYKCFQILSRENDTMFYAE